MSMEGFTLAPIDGDIPWAPVTSKEPATRTIYSHQAKTSHYQQIPRSNKIQIKRRESRIRKTLTETT